MGDRILGGGKESDWGTNCCCGCQRSPGGGDEVDKGGNLRGSFMIGGEDL
jgi:hypothetical protein